MNKNERTELMLIIQKTLEQFLIIEDFHITDDSAQHIGHAGAREGRGHFSVFVVSPDFNGIKRIARHQLIYNALGDLMKTSIHALAIQAIAADEF